MTQQMSELKAFEVTRKALFGRTCTEKVYLKSEADKVIAELEESHKKEVGQLWIEIAELQKQVHDYAQGLYVMQARAENEARRHKYNRCLLRSVIAEMNATHFKDLFYGAGSEALADEYNKQITIHYKWQKRWLALAEKFKESK